jgi:hypothetical protein
MNHTDTPAPQPVGVITNSTGEASRPEACRFCMYLQYPVNGVPAPAAADDETKTVYRNSGYCRRASPGPNAEKSARTFWPIVHVDEDWCGHGVV